MEAFLSTLPPYVHEFIDKYPPTDVFNLLKELICFAVLYSDDRERINQSTEELLKKRKQQLEDQQVQHEDKSEEKQEEAIVPEPNHIAIESIKEETESEIKNLEETKPTYNIRTGELIHTDNSKMPNTFPQWWGHYDAEPVSEKVAHLIDNGDPKPQSVGPAWISWDAINDTINHTNHRQMGRAKSQIIPDLRSYLEDDKKVTASRTVPTSSSTTAKKRHSMYNMKTSTPPVSRSSTNASPLRTPPPAASVKASHRLSAPICDSPAITTTPSSKPVQISTKKTLTDALSQINPDTPSTHTRPARSASLNIRQPRPNAAMKARAEHAKLQQEEFERKKSAPAVVPLATQRIKQRANSAINWSSVKQERRKTISEVPKPE